MIKKIILIICICLLLGACVTSSNLSESVFNAGGNGNGGGGNGNGGGGNGNGGGGNGNGGGGNK